MNNLSCRSQKCPLNSRGNPTLEYSFHLTGLAGAPEVGNIQMTSNIPYDKFPVKIKDISQRLLTLQSPPSMIQTCLDDDRVNWRYGRDGFLLSSRKNKFHLVVGGLPVPHCFMLMLPLGIISIIFLNLHECTTQKSS